jgi:hypothetical protein
MLFTGMTTSAGAKSGWVETALALGGRVRALLLFGALAMSGQALQYAQSGPVPRDETLPSIPT